MNDSDLMVRELERLTIEREPRGRSRYPLIMPVPVSESIGYAIP